MDTVTGRPWDQRPRGCVRPALAAALIGGALALACLGETLDWARRAYGTTKARHG